ncbi:MAG TPA: uroporphyrinogen decarboxylase family protein [Chloroflexota bacterium]|nr:uroporphyrinogen decarboxylase family protein [Chloroflexota bacterium]
MLPLPPHGGGGWGEGTILMNKRQRVLAALAGEPVDRPPVSAWRHFVDREQNAADLADAMLEFHRTYDWDWLKVNPRATYFAEAWGNTYDFSQYVSVVPRASRVRLESVCDLAMIEPVDPAGGAFGEQLDALDRIRRGLDGDAPIIQTVFSPLSVIGWLAGGPAGFEIPGLPASLPLLRRAIEEAPDALEAALDAVTTTLTEYARITRAAGADGIFFAIVRLARHGYLSREEYARFGRPYDLRVLGAVADAPFNVLHVCGDQVYFDAIAEYPVHAISWNSQAPGNPSFGDAMAVTSSALMGGVDESATLPSGTPADVTRAASAALSETGGQRTLLAPGCSIDHRASPDNLVALRDAARDWKP